jgi:Brp/Blh family beta-carotene 15,15'-monooxygenase
MALRVAPLHAPETGRGIIASPGLFSWWQLGLFGALAIALGLYAFGYDLGGASGTALVCMALLIFGLPHGSLDIALLSGVGRPNLFRTIVLVMLYVGCAAAMYVTWQLTPVFALGIFLALACSHFSEDWRDTLPPFFAVGTAVAMMTAPVLFHRSELSEIFAGLTGASTSAIWMQVSVLVAPVALVSAMIGAVAIDRSTKAVETIASLAGMILLPPVIGFGLFFCLSHSPVHFMSAVKAVKGVRSARWQIEALSVTLAALGISVLIFVDWASASATDGIITASFVTLSILTVPHMLVPRIVSMFAHADQPIA